MFSLACALQSAQLLQEVILAKECGEEMFIFSSVSTTTLIIFMWTSPLCWRRRTIIPRNMHWTSCQRCPWPPSVSYERTRNANQFVLFQSTRPEVLWILKGDVGIVVRCPFREEHLAVCQNFFFLYMASGPRCPVMSHHVPPRGGLLVAYLSNCWRYRLDLGLVGKVFESAFQISKNGIYGNLPGNQMQNSPATRCKWPNLRFFSW